MTLSILLAILFFFFFFAVIALALVSLQLRDIFKKKRTYSCFSGMLNEILIIVNKDGDVLDATPEFISDPLCEQIMRKRSLREVFSKEEYDHFGEYIQKVSLYPEVPYVFSYDSDKETRWYEIRAKIKNRDNGKIFVLLLKNVTQDVVAREQRDRLQDNVNMFLSNMGDFLWSLDLDTRKFTFLSPLVDLEGHEIPRSCGVQDLKALMPEDDFRFFESHVNKRVVIFREKGYDAHESHGIRCRLKLESGTFVWYAICGKLYSEENAKIVFRGVARRMEQMVENPIVENGNVNESMMASALAFPDIRIFWIDRSYKVCGCNQTFSMAFGMPLPQDVEGKRLLEVVRPKYFSFFHGILSDVFERGLPKTWKGPFGPGRQLLWFNAVPIKQQDGYTSRVLGVYMLLDVDEFDKL